MQLNCVYLWSFQQGMQALLDLIFAVEGSVSEAAKHLGYLIYALSIFFYLGVVERVKPQ